VFSFFNGPEYLQAVQRRFLGTSNGLSPARAHIFLFGSQIPPQGIQDIQFDIQDPVQVMSEAIGYVSVNWEFLLPQMAMNYSGTLWDAFGSNHLFKQHYLEPTRNLWRIFPKFVVRESVWRAHREGRYTQAQRSQAYIDAANLPMVFHNDPDLVTPGSSVNQIYTTSSRYPYLDPFVMEFDQEVTLTRFDLMQTHSGSRYDNTGLNMQVWDNNANAGAGDWGPPQVISYGGGNTKNEITLAEPMTGTRFRIYGYDTSRDGWIMKHFAWFSSVEPTNRQPFDANWALIGPAWNGSNNPYNGGPMPYSTWSVNGPEEIAGFPDAFPTSESILPRIPWIACTVGDTEKEGAILLSTATNITGREQVDPQFIRLSF
jgi:hypothetical protein